MASEKASVTLDPWQLQNVRLRGYLSLLEEEFGRVPEELREEARREWDAMKASWRDGL